MLDAENTPPASPVHSEADDEDSSETESERNDRDQESVADDAEDDKKSILTTSTELSEEPALDLLGISRPATPDVDTEATPPPLGLNRPWGWSYYDDYDVIAVHGLRDDHSTAWKSKSGKPWLRDRLFEKLSIRQLDYSYATDESARIFQRNGIKAEAQNLLRLYSEERRRLEDASTEVDRPIIWVCHDIGGTIVKQVLIEAAQATLAEGYEDAETWEFMKEAHRRISTFSTAIIFLGCPHRAESIEVLEDELYNLMSLPGPDVKKGIMRKIKDMAYQVNDVNIRALDGNLFSRLVNINTFYLPDLPKEAETKQESSVQEEEHQNATIQQDTSQSVPHSSTPLIEFPTPPASPFSQYTLTTGHWMEIDSRCSQCDIDHANLVRGDEGVEEYKSWVTKLDIRFDGSYYPLKIFSDFINRQVALLSLAPTIRYPRVYVYPAGILSKSGTPPFLDWILKYQNDLRDFNNGLGPRVLYIHGVADPARTAMLSQYWHLFNAELLSWIQETYGGNTFSFEFSKFDSRRNTIRSMLVTYLNEMAWLSWSMPGCADGVRWLFENLEYFGSWSLPDLFKIFKEVRRNLARFEMRIYLACFDSCVEEERTWFLKAVLDQHSHSDMNDQLIITASNPDSLLNDSVPESRLVHLTDCPAELNGFAIDEKGIHGSGLAVALEDVLRQRPVLNSLKQTLEALMEECKHTPHLGYRILDWLSRFGRGTPTASISATIEKLRPVTPESVISVVIGSLPLEKRKWAVLVHRWVRYAMEPLTIEVLGHALAASTSSGDELLLDIDCEQLSDNLQKEFSGIIVIDGRDIKFVHESFHDAPIAGVEECKDEQPSFVHGAIAETCLKYLMHGQVQTQYRKLAVDNYGGDHLKRPLFLPRENLLEYAVQYWPEHYRLAGSHRPLALALEFFRETEARNKWAEGYYLLSNPFTRIQRSYFSPLPLMAALGLDDLIADQTKHEESSKWFHQDSWLAITEAARHGHKSILCMLLDRAQADESGLQDALFWAASSGNEEVLSLLVNKVASKDSFSRPASLLSRAAFAGSDLVISALAKTGLNLDQQNDDIKQSAIETAIVWGHSSVVKLLLESGAGLSSRDADGRTRLLLAVRMCQPEIVQLLLDNGASLDEKDKDGMSVVNAAIAAGDPGTLKVLIAAGADFKSGDFGFDINSLCPIVHAADHGRPGCLQILIESGADPLTEAEGGSILYLVCQFGNQLANCRLLLEKGANPNQTYPDKEMMLTRVLRRNSKELIELFLDNGANPDSFDPWEEAEAKTPLTFASYNCSYEVMKTLLDKGASPNYGPDGAESALLAAAWRGDDIKKAELLLERGADLDWKRSDGWTPLQTAYDSPKFVTLFLKHGADVERQTEDGTVLMMAARWNFVETLKTLVAHQNPRPDLDTRYTYEDNEFRDYTALTFAVSNGAYGCANFLLEAGAKLVDQLNDAAFILQQDVEKEQIDEMVKFMKACLERGVKPDQVDKDGNIPLHGIRSSTPVSVIQLLIDAGAPVDTPNTAGWTPLAMAVEHGNTDAVKLLLSKYARPTVCSPSFGSLLFLACKEDPAAATKVIDLLKLLLEAKVDPNAPGPEPSKPPLLYTVIRKTWDSRVRHKLVRYLVDAGAHINAPAGVQLHPIIAAVEKSDLRLVQYLIRLGANVNAADSQGRRAIHYAISTNTATLKRYRIFRKAGADLQSPDNYGRTPFHLACGFGYTFEVEWLFRKVPGLDVDERDVDGWTPLMWACKLDRSNGPMVEELRDRGASFWSRSKDGEWSALKLACFSDMGMETRERLDPRESERERVGPDGVQETWDPLFHTAEPGRTHVDVTCDGCFLRIIGPRYKCTACEVSNDLCFKCFPHRATMHDSSHEFEEYVETYNEGGSQGEPSVVDDGRASVSSGSRRAKDDDSRESEESDSESDDESSHIAD
ncbi:ankyrin repeat-containing domain protein [Ilyonectria robusta]|uniref:ankyrin repeat-containing domain protein n=1 Tax=Ilyonectria robusta TaxID=1079257 RepID=UPI001E8CA1CB|nr:ankyrin repeat-containing domain protein [Ilyonectria robusta]KAH8733608.1 ankyrin repeat-containing domain protein [Ilyonectria robusta]